MPRTARGKRITVDVRGTLTPNEPRSSTHPPDKQDRRSEAGVLALPLSAPWLAPPRLIQFARAFGFSLIPANRTSRFASIR
jgi:hypothetical protein